MVKSILSETAEVLLRPAPLLRAIHAFRNLAFIHTLRVTNPDSRGHRSLHRWYAQPRMPSG